MLGMQKKLNIDYITQESFQEFRTAVYECNSNSRTMRKGQLLVTKKGIVQVFACER